MNTEDIYKIQNSGLNMSLKVNLLDSHLDVCGKVSLFLIKHDAMKACVGTGDIPPPLLTSALDGSELLASRPGLFHSEKESSVPIG